MYMKHYWEDYGFEPENITRSKPLVRTLTYSQAPANQIRAFIFRFAPLGPVLDILSLSVDICVWLISLMLL